MGIPRYWERYHVDISEETVQQLRDDIHTLLLGIDRSEAITYADKLADSPYPLNFLYIEVLQPVLYTIGEEWASGAITVIREHIASSLASSMVAVLYHRHVNGMPVTKPTIAVCVVPGNLHELGPRMLADLLEQAQYRSIVISPPVDLEMLREFMHTQQPAALAVSASEAAQIDETRTVAAQLRRDGYAGLIAAGGYALQGYQADALRESGVDWTGSDVLAFIPWLNEHL